MGSRKRITIALLGLVVLVVAGWLLRDAGSSPGGQAPPSSSRQAPATDVPGARGALPVRELSSLPKEAADTWRLIEKGGPFPYPRNDGVTFGNREKILPAQKSGYYREYTVPTPGSPDRGARRIVTGSAQEVYYTDDHYASFSVVDVRR